VRTNSATDIHPRRNYIDSNNTVDVRVLSEDPRHPPTQIPRNSGDEYHLWHRILLKANNDWSGLLLVAALNPRLAQQLAMLLLRHALAALLDD